MSDNQPTPTKQKRKVKEYEFVGGDAADRVQGWISQSNQRLLIFEYNRRSVLKFPLSVALVVVPVLFLLATPFAWALTIGLAALGLLTKFGLRIEPR